MVAWWGDVEVEVEKVVVVGPAEELLKLRNKITTDYAVFYELDDRAFWM